MALFIPTYFSSIAQYSMIVQSDAITFEIQDHFQKQSYQNRCYIYNTNGKQLLTIPIKHQKSTMRKKTKDTRIENNFPWQSQHFKSLQSAYRRSPYFEFYEDDLYAIFKKKYEYLLDVNIDTFLFLTDALQIDIPFLKTSKYEKNPLEKDWRFLLNVKKASNIKMDVYPQLFSDKHGFIPNLSILDLLFMEGPNTILFLEKINVL